METTFEIIAGLLAFVGVITVISIITYFIAFNFYKGKGRAERLIKDENHEHQTK